MFLFTNKGVTSVWSETVELQRELMEKADIIQKLIFFKKWLIFRNVRIIRILFLKKISWWLWSLAIPWQKYATIDKINSSQVKIKYKFSKPFHSKRFSKDGNRAESEQFLWPFNYIQRNYKTIIQ